MYGKTIKKIRQDKGLKQKDIAQDIVTLSYFSRIERDISSPTIDVFLKLIKNLNVSLEEFVFIHNNYTKTHSDNLWFEITELYHSGNSLALNDYKNRLLEGNTKNEDPLFLTIIIDLFLNRLDNTDIKIDVLPIVNNLMNLENWTSREVKIFTTIMDVIPLEILLVLVNRLLRQRNLYCASGGYDSPYNKILINLIFLCIDNLRLVEATTYLKFLLGLIEVRDLFGKTMCLYLEGLILYLTNRKKDGEKKIEDAFNIFKLLNMDDFSEKYKLYFNDLKKQVDPTLRE